MLSVDSWSAPLQQLLPLRMQIWLFAALAAGAIAMPTNSLSKFPLFNCAVKFYQKAQLPIDLFFYSGVNAYCSSLGLHVVYRRSKKLTGTCGFIGRFHFIIFTLRECSIPKSSECGFPYSLCTYATEWLISISCPICFHSFCLLRGSGLS